MGTTRKGSARSRGADDHLGAQAHQLCRSDSDTAYARLDECPEDGCLCLPSCAPCAQERRSRQARERREEQERELTARWEERERRRNLDPERAARRERDREASERFRAAAEREAAERRVRETEEARLAAERQALEERRARRLRRALVGLNVAACLCVVAIIVLLAPLLLTTLKIAGALAVIAVASNLGGT